MGQTQGMKGKDRKKERMVPGGWLKKLAAYILLVTLVAGNVSGHLSEAFAGQKARREEFRIHAEEIQRAAEEALDGAGQAEEIMEWDSRDKTLIRQYEELFEADGTLYEIYPEYETLNGTDGLNLRVFIRISSEADPAAYALTGDEELIFLYENEGDETVSGRLNIDGYISGYCTVKPYEAAFGEDEEKGPGQGNTSGGGQTQESVKPSEDAGTEAEPETGTEETEESADSTQAPETEESTGPEESADETEAGGEDQTEGSTGESDSEDGSEEPEETEGEAEAGTEEDAGSQEGTGDTETDDSSDEAEDTGEEGAAEDTENNDDSGTAVAMSIHVRHLLTSAVEGDSVVEIQESKEETETQETEAETEEETEAETETEEETEKETADMPSQETVPESESAAQPEESLPELPEETAEEPPVLEDEEENSFERVGVLEGKTYNLVSLDQTVTARAFVTSLSKTGLDYSELEGAAHIIDYMTDPVGSVRLIDAPKLVRDGARVTFGIIPQPGYQVMEVTANGEELATIEPEDIATSSKARRATDSNATSSNADPAPEAGAIYYEIPDVLEDQEVEVFMEETVAGSHPAFRYSEELNGVTVTVSAEEGILQKGTTAQIKEVTGNVEQAVKEKAEEDAAGTGMMEVTSVLAYDITLFDEAGYELDDSWSERGYVHVSFSGEPIEEKSKEATQIEIAHVETEADTVQDVLTAQEVSGLEVVADGLELDGDSSVGAVQFNAEHFSTYTLIFGNDQKKIQVKVVDSTGNPIGTNNSINLPAAALEENGIEIQTIVEDIISKDSALNGYGFEKATATYQSQEVTFTAIRYYGRWRQQLSIKIDGEWETVGSGNYSYSNLKIYLKKTIKVPGSLTVFGKGTASIHMNGSTKPSYSATEQTPVENAELTDPYLLKFTPGEGLAVGALYINKKAIPITDISRSGEYTVSGFTETQEIEVYFTKKVEANLKWKRSDLGGTDGVEIIHNKKLNFDWDDIGSIPLDNESPWDTGDYYGEYADDFEGRSFATWARKGGEDDYDVRRFQTTFTIPEDYTAADYIRIKTVGTDEYLELNDGNIIPINDDIFIFVYEEGEPINNGNYLDYLAFWSGTSTVTHGVDGFNGIKATYVTQDATGVRLFPYTDGWYCEADLDNIGEKIFDNYHDSKEGTTFVLDVFVGEFASGGGMDELMVEFVKSNGYAVRVNYYKDEVTDPEDEDHYLGTRILKGQLLGSRVVLTDDEDPTLNEFQPKGYGEGRQLNAPYIVIDDDNGVINVLYTKKTANVKVEYYTRDSASDPAEKWTRIYTEPEDSFPIGISYETAVNKELGKAEIPENERDFYDNGIVIDGTKLITEDTMVIKVVYTKRNIDLTVKKQLVGRNTDPSALSSVKFKIYQSDATWQKLGDPILTDLTPDKDGLVSMNLPFVSEEQNYLLYETATANGYIPLTEPVKLTVTFNEATEAVSYKVVGSDETYTAESPYVIQNHAGAILPETGGQGIQTMMHSGMALVLASAVYQGFGLGRRRKRHGGNV